jgi:CHAT domain-containing protein
VDQIASTILMGDLITRLRVTSDVPAALAKAQHYLRSLTGSDVAQWPTDHLPTAERLAEFFLKQQEPFGQPLYWAGFCGIWCGSADAADYLRLSTNCAG